MLTCEEPRSRSSSLLSEAALHSEGFQSLGCPGPRPAILPSVVSNWALLMSLCLLSLSSRLGWTCLGSHPWLASRLYASRLWGLRCCSCPAAHFWCIPIYLPAIVLSMPPSSVSLWAVTHAYNITCRGGAALGRPPDRASGRGPSCRCWTAISSNIELKKLVKEGEHAFRNLHFHARRLSSQK